MDGRKSRHEDVARGATILFVALVLRGGPGEELQTTSQNLLQHLSLLFVPAGTGIMVMGDYYQFPDRERAFEIRTLTAGSFTLLKAGQLHALYNVTDEDLQLLMFGGYD